MKCAWTIASIIHVGILSCGGGTTAFIPVSVLRTSGCCCWSKNGKITARASSSLAASARPAIAWVKQEPLDSLLSKQDVVAILAELVSDAGLLNESEALVEKNWNSLESRLRKETRSCRDILGQEATTKLLKAVQSVDEYDAETVQAFLSSDAITNLFSKVLYDGIFEFFQKIDVFGQIINSLPIIGPIRKQIVTETKKQLDRSLGPLVQNFLSSYTKIAVQQASDYVLSPTNRQAFGNANVNLVSSLLDRPVNSLFPPMTSTMSDSVRSNVFDYLRQVDVKTEWNDYVDLVYDLAGDKSLDELVDVDRVIDASPTLQNTLDRLWTNALDAKNQINE